MCVCVCVHAYECASACTRVQTHVCTCTRTYIHLYTHVHLHSACLHTRVYMYTHVHVCACVCVCLCPFPCGRKECFCWHSYFEANRTAKVVSLSCHSDENINPELQMPFEAPSCLTPVNLISNLTQGWVGVGEVGGGGKSMATTKLLQPSCPEPGLQPSPPEGQNQG